MHANNVMKDAGFRYIGDGTTVCCDRCGLKVSEWTSDMRPLTIHAQRSPTCSFILSRMFSGHTQASPRRIYDSSAVIACSGEESSERQKTTSPTQSCPQHGFTEVKKMKDARRRTFSHWPSRTSPTSAQMIAAGFFCCNVGDRVICIYCKIICQQWAPNTDDPWEVHKTMSPTCAYVIGTLRQQQMPTIHIANETIHSVPVQLRQTFVKWPEKDIVMVDGLVQAGFFYTATGKIVTCFYCNGSLQKWRNNDNPTIEHARYFPGCKYAEKLCGPDLHRNIQANQHGVQGIFHSVIRLEKKLHSSFILVANGCYSYNVRIRKSNINSSRESVQPCVDKSLSPIVEARLDLVSRDLMEKFRKSLIRRCFEKQQMLESKIMTFLLLKEVLHPIDLYY